MESGGGIAKRFREVKSSYEGRVDKGGTISSV